MDNVETLKNKIAELKAENERLKNWPHTDNSAVIANLLEELSSTKRTL